MKGVCTDDDGRVCIGGATTHAAVAPRRRRYPGLAGLAAQIGDPAVRNRGTIGGSLANNDPVGLLSGGGAGVGRDDRDQQPRDRGG